MKPDHYDSFADSYSAENESSLLNAYYERPAMIALTGNVDGHRVQDAGCGSGPLSAALNAKGAIMTGFDASPAMLKDWSAPLAELRRVLKPGGRPILSVNHPTVSVITCRPDLLAPATSRDVQRLYVGGIPRSHCERTRASSRHTQGAPSAPHRQRREDGVPVLHLLRSRSRQRVAEGLRT